MSYFAEHSLSEPQNRASVQITADTSGFMSPLEQVQAIYSSMRETQAATRPIPEVNGDYQDARGYNDILNRLFQEGDNSNQNPAASKEFVAGLRDLKTLDEEPCSICLDKCEKAVLLPKCRHKYHLKCITPWLTLHNTCPYCRMEFPTDDREYEREKQRKVDQAIKDADSEEEYNPFYN